MLLSDKSDSLNVGFGIDFAFGVIILNALMAWGLTIWTFPFTVSLSGG